METAQEKEARSNKGEKDIAQHAAMARKQRDVIFQASREENLIKND